MSTRSKFAKTLQALKMLMASQFIFLMLTETDVLTSVSLR